MHGTCPCVERPAHLFVSVFPPGLCICIQVSHTQRSAEGKWQERRKGRGAVELELWILKDFPSLQDWERDGEREVKPEN